MAKKKARRIPTRKKLLKLAELIRSVNSPDKKELK